jgi:hypothetical protein
VFYELADAKYIDQATIAQGHERVANSVRSLIQMRCDLLIAERTVLLQEF